MLLKDELLWVVNDYLHNVQYLQWSIYSNFCEWWHEIEMSISEGEYTHLPVLGQSWRGKTVVAWPCEEEGWGVAYIGRMILETDPPGRRKKKITEKIYGCSEGGCRGGECDRTFSRQITVKKGDLLWQPQTEAAEWRRGLVYYSIQYCISQHCTRLSDFS